MSSQAPARSATTPPVTTGAIFWAFLVMGATSFGGGVVAYLRAGLVAKRGWIDDPTFVRFMAMSQSLPGLTASNVAVLVGDHLRGAAGAAAAVIGMCLPGAVFMTVAGALFVQNGNGPAVTAMLHGVAAAAVGLVFSVTLQLGKKSVERPADLIFVAVTAVAVTLFHVSVLHALIAVGAAAIWWHRPRPAAEPGKAAGS